MFDDGGFDRTCGQAAQTVRHFTYASSTTHSASHAVLSRCVAADQATFGPRGGKLYGGQCVGCDGADKRIDQIALLIKQEARLQSDKVEHAYAPPFHRQKDPIAIITAGYVPKQHHQRGDACGDLAANGGSGSLRHAVFWMCVPARNTRLQSDPQFRWNIPLDELRGRIGELPRDKSLHLLRRWSTGIPGLENSDGTRVYRYQADTKPTATAPIENKTATIRTNSKTDTQHTGERINLENRRLRIAVPRRS